MKYLITFLVFFTFLILRAQEKQQEAQIINKGVPEVEVFKPFKNEYYSKYFSLNYFFEINNLIVNIRARGGVLHDKLELRLTDPSNGAIINFSEKIFEPREVYFETVEQIGDVIYAFYSEYDKQKNQETFNSCIITIKNNEFHIQEKRELIIIKGKTNSDAKYNPAIINHTNSGKFELKLNKNINRFVVKYSPKNNVPSNTKHGESFGFSIFDKDLIKVQESFTELPKSFLTIIDFTVDSNNSILSIVKDPAVSSSPKPDKYYIVELNSNNEYVEKEFVIDNHIVDIKLEYDKKDVLYIFGYYKVEKHKRPIKGVFCCTFENSQFSKIKFNDFSFNFVTQYKKLSKSKKNKLIKTNLNKGRYGIYSLTIKSIVKTNDGSIVMIGERKYYGNSSTASYCELIISKLSFDEQEFVWHSKVPRFEPTNQLYIGNTNNYLYLVFPDNTKNASIKDDGEIFNDNSVFKKSIAAYQVDLQNGEKSRYQISENDIIAGQNVDKINADCMLILSNDKLIIELAYQKDLFGYFKVNF